MRSVAVWWAATSRVSRSTASVISTRIAITSRQAADHDEDGAERADRVLHDAGGVAEQDPVEDQVEVPGQDRGEAEVDDLEDRQQAEDDAEHGGEDQARAPWEHDEHRDADEGFQRDPYERGGVQGAVVVRHDEPEQYERDGEHGEHRAHRHPHPRPRRSSSRDPPSAAPPASSSASASGPLPPRRATGRVVGRVVSGVVGGVVGGRRVVGRPACLASVGSDCICCICCWPRRPRRPRRPRPPSSGARPSRPPSSGARRSGCRRGSGSGELVDGGPRRAGVGGVGAGVVRRIRGAGLRGGPAEAGDEGQRDDLPSGPAGGRESTAPAGAARNWRRVGAAGGSAAPPPRAGSPPAPAPRTATPS